MNFTHVKNKIFVVRSGFLVIGRRTYGEPGLDRWAIELRWHYRLLPVCSFRLYYGASRPSKRRILLCAVFAPLLTGLQWLILLPLFFVMWGVGLAYFLGTLCVGWLFVGLGRWLVKIGRLGR